MELESKWNVGDELYTIANMKIVKFKVSSVSIFGGKTFTNVSYFGDGYDSYKEDNCFKTEEELLNFLRRD